MSVNQDNTNQLVQKQRKALRLLDEFKEWYMHIDKSGHQLMFINLTHDIITGDKDKVDYLINHLTEKNMQAMLLKMMK